MDSKDTDLIDFGQAKNEVKKSKSIDEFGDIKKKKEKKNIDEKAADELTASDVHSVLVSIMLGKQNKLIAAMFPSGFHHNYRVISDSDNKARTLIKVSDDNIATVASEYQFACDVIQWCKSHGEFSLFYNFTMKKAKEVVEDYVGLADASPMPAEILFKSDTELCFKRLDFDYTPQVNISMIPLFDELMSRATNRNAVEIFIGSLFDDSKSYKDNKNHQYLWIYGSGGNGKSSLTSCLSSLFGNACGVYDPKADYYFDSFFGKRLTIIPDTNNFQFVSSSLFKNLTGGDEIVLNQKYQIPIKYKPNTKLIVTSNHYPNISEPSDLRRIIFSEFGKVEKRDPTYQQRLQVEMRWWICYCIDKYGDHMVNTNYGEIPIDEESHEAMIEQGSVEYDLLLDRMFFIKPDNQELILFYSDLAQVCIDEYGKQNYRIHLNRFKQFIIQKGHTYKKVWCAKRGNAFGAFLGICFKKDPEAARHI